MVLAALGRFPEARQALEAAVRLDPESHDAWDTYARVLSVLGAPEAPVVGGIAARLAPRSVRKVGDR
jgi:tetratricopeptide (TPR) repeat protein